MRLSCGLMFRSCLTVADTAVEGCPGAWQAVTSTPVGGIFGLANATVFTGTALIAVVSQPGVDR